MIVWHHYVIGGKPVRGESDADRVRHEMHRFLEGGELSFGAHTKWDAGDILWELAANAAEWSGEQSADVYIETDGRTSIHVVDKGAGVESTLGRPAVEAFTLGVSASRKRGRGRGLSFVCEMTARGGEFVLETGDQCIVCIDGAVSCASKSTSTIEGTHATFFFQR